MAEDDDELIPESGAVFTFGRSRFADNYANKFWIKNDPVLHVACGDEHSAVLTQRGRVYVFGSNDWGQLGLGHTKVVTKPSFIKSLKADKIVLIACGRSHSMVYAESKKLFSFGANEDGQLGHGGKQNEHVPKEVESLSGVGLKSISCGAYHSAALTDEGDVYVWGVNSDGQIGLGDQDECDVPTKLQVEHPVRSVSCGYYHTAFVTTQGTLFTFGEDELGKLGLSEQQCDDTTRPQAVAKLNGDRYASVSCGGRHTVAFTEKGKCYSWGDGSNGQLGHGTKLQEIALPTLIEGLDSFEIVGLSCGDGHTAVVTKSGKILTFGDGRHGKLGQGDECFSNLFVPTLVTRFKGFHVNYVSCGGCHMLVGAIRDEEPENDEVDGDALSASEDILNASIRSTASIAEANATLKPGSMTYPIRPRDKRRNKGEDPLNSSLNASLDLNSSLNMAQLNRTVPVLPQVLDRSKLPKIQGMNQINFNNYEKTEQKSVDADASTPEKEKKKSSRLVAAISFSRDENKQSETIKPGEGKTRQKKMEKLAESGESDEDNKMKENDKISDKDQADDEIDGVLDRNKKFKRTKKIEDEDMDEEDDGFDSNDEEMMSKNVKKKPEKSEKLDGKDKMKNVESNSGRSLPTLDKPSKKVKDKDDKVEKDEDDEDDNEGDTDEDDTKLKHSSKQKTGGAKKKEKVTPLKEVSTKSPAKKNKKPPIESEDEEEEEENDDLECISEIEDGEEEDEEEDKEEDVEEEEDEDEGEDEEEEEEESELEVTPPVVKKKKDKEVKSKGASKEDTPKKKGIETEDKLSKQKSKGLKKQEKKTEESETKSKSSKKEKDKRKGISKKVEVEEDEDEEDDEDEDEDEEEEDGNEEEEDEDDEKDDEEDDGDGAKDAGKDHGNKKKNNKKRKKDQTEEKDKSNGTNENTKVEETPETVNRSGFLKFFRRNKKTQSTPETKSPERTQSPTQPGNQSQSKTCVIL